ncbi:ABC transporter [Heterobasidion irregulare TC 32-1]|uniref:ABC transporter n=1 Tax=Heterobasidion irregulare (strain TC 32-1) TaxID=747525 RepID=W4KP39_HETIT|nr:ABC transporter [Heterobasidion irregulare TC 32-1]ETW86786.1 ABC transporter [Heterobasidion irregulare TC 32-1]
MSETPFDAHTLQNEPLDQSDAHHVDVQEAENAFHTLSRRLTRRHNHSTTSREYDPEKAAPSDEEPFDLREYLSSSNDANEKAGIKHKHVGVTWEDLQVEIAGSAFTKLTLRRRNSGVLKPGEMCLVLGTPGSGCDTFLKAIANQRGLFHRVSGDVRYAGISAEEMGRYYHGELVYNAEDDIHLATLTVDQTLDFALSTKAPGSRGRQPGVSRAGFKDEVKATLLKMLNISHTAKTLVGDAFVRGVSGGERKRVSIAEMMATRARVQCWDNSSRGLDASTALDFVKSLRVMTDVLGQTTFVTLYQAGEGIYDLFDKVMILNQGRQVYLGSPSEARAWFEELGYRSLPRQSTADYLTGCTDPNERQFAPGRSELNVPSTPEALEQAYLASKTAKKVRTVLEDYKRTMETEKNDQEAFRASVADDKKRGVSRKSPYTLSLFDQVKALTRRQFQVRLQDRFQIFTSYALSTALALVIGGAFFNLPPTSAGAFTRGSVIFVAGMTSSFETFSELPMQMLGRPLVAKQKSYGFYRPAAIQIANTLADIPFSATRVLIYDIIVYFMPHLSYSAGGFFTFHLLNYMCFLTMQGFFRTVGLMCPNFDTALRLSVFFFPNMVIYVGYMIPVDQMKRWLFWIFYLNPFSYVWAACMENEFMRLTLTCDGTYVVPRNGPGMTKYPDTLGPNQACTLPGSSPGSIFVAGRDYVRAGYGLDVADLWRRNFVVVLGFMIFFWITQVIAIEYWPQPIGGGGVAYFARESSERKKLNDALRARKAEKAAREREEKARAIEGTKETRDLSKFSDRKVFTWERVNYHVPVAGGTAQLLTNVYGYVRPGTLTALMGASGAGKTTCLDVLAQRKNIGVVSGDILVDGKPLDFDFARGTAYAEQMDVHEGTATIREAMRFSAYLRQPKEVPKEEKDAYVEDMIELLELQDLADALVYTLGVEARKRLTIGVELASKPELLLFLDEPTSGLDAQSAWNLVRFLRKLADNGQAILCTIHQPSALLFESFDRLLLLARGGNTIYFGDIGEDAHIMRDYFARNGAECPHNVNPAEFMLEAIGAGVTPRIGNRDWKDIWLESPECQRAKDEILALKEQAIAHATPMWYQLKVVVDRNTHALWRSPAYVFTRLLSHLMVSLLVSLPFLQLGHSVRDLQYRVFGIFWTAILPGLVIPQLEPVFIMNRMTFVRESSSRIYSPYVFAIGQLLGEIPYSIACAIFYWVLMVYPMGFGDGSAGTNGTGFQLLVIIFTELFSVTLGQFIASISPTIQVAVLYTPFISVVLNTFCGVTVPYNTLSHFWKSWMYQLDPFTRMVAAMLSTELHGLVITCKPEEFARFTPPSNQTCQAWASDFVTALGGYLDNPNDTSECRYCQYQRGDEFFLPLNIRFENRWRDVWIFFCFFVFNFMITIIASRFLRFAKR